MVSNEETTGEDQPPTEGPPASTTRDEGELSPLVREMVAGADAFVAWLRAGGTIEEWEARRQDREAEMSQAPKGQ